MSREAPRRCGACTECCPMIAEINARAGQDAGPCDCGPDPSRAVGCSGFRCLWVQGFGEIRDRPDRLGVVLAATEREDGAPLVLAWETRPGAVAARRASAYVEHLAGKVLTVVVARPPHEARPKVVDVRQPDPASPPTRIRRGRRISLEERSMRRRRQ